MWIRPIPYTLEEIELKHRECVCDEEDCPARSPFTKYYFFSRFAVGGTIAMTWWHSRS